MTTYPSASFPLLDGDTVTDRIRAAIDRGDPFSMIRLGDGEGTAMSISESSWLEDLGYLETHWGGEGVHLGDVLRVCADLRASVQDADLVGMRPDLVGVVAPDDLLSRSCGDIAEFVRAEFGLRAQERDGLGSHGARRLALLHREVTRFDWGAGQEFCSQWVHWELLASGALAELLAGLDEVGIVTAKPRLPELVAEGFGIQARAVVVPDKFVDTRLSGAHVPDRYDTIRPDLDFPQGTVVLVGAGIPGKTYCRWIKEAGGIALDVGSVMDAWIGEASRPLVLASRFRVPGGRYVPTHLRIDHQSSSDPRVLTPRWKPDTILEMNE